MQDQLQLFKVLLLNHGAQVTKHYIVLLGRYTCRFIGVSVRNFLYEKVLDMLSISIKYFAYISQKLIKLLNTLCCN